VVSYYLSTAIAESDRAVRVLGYQCLVQSTSNPVPSAYSVGGRKWSVRSSSGGWCLRNSHVDLWVFGGGVHLCLARGLGFPCDCDHRK